MATNLRASNEAERWLLSRSGYGPKPEDQARYVILCKIDGDSVKSHYDAYSWGDQRTMRVAHEYIIRNFHKLESGDVIDVQFILGETSQPKVSEAVGA
jgi:hypothetical protein